jgi:steroid 5-alpha reductase family enzyme
LPVKEDDKRYIRITANYKSRYEVFLKIFLVQAVLAFLVSLTLHPSTYFNDRLEINYYLLAAGIFIYAVGLFVESWADWTLWRFKIKNPEKKLCKEGPWAWSRHPNYFGEMLIWWGLFLAFAIHSEWYISLIGPVLITFLLTKVSGAPLIETDKKNDAEYQKYISQTNKYFPNPFKKGVSNERY